MAFKIGGYIPFSLLFGQNRVNWEGRRGPRNLFSIGIPILLVTEEPMQNFETPAAFFLVEK